MTHEDCTRRLADEPTEAFLAHESFSCGAHVGKAAIWGCGKNQEYQWHVQLQAELCFTRGPAQSAGPLNMV